MNRRQEVLQYSLNSLIWISQTYYFLSLSIAQFKALLVILFNSFETYFSVINTDRRSSVKFRNLFFALSQGLQIIELIIFHDIWIDELSSSVILNCFLDFWGWKVLHIWSSPRSHGSWWSISLTYIKWIFGKNIIILWCWRK